MLEDKSQSDPCVYVMSSSDSRLTNNPAGGCRHINQINDVFGSDAQQTAAVDVTAPGAVPVGRGGERPFVHDASDNLKLN